MNTIKTISVIACFCLLVPMWAQTLYTQVPETLMGHRYLTLNTFIRVNQIEVARDRNVGHDERDRHTPEAVKTFREAIEKGFP
ncbi:MAG: hypothetical protein LBR10_16050 [Prevotellaceae bacterium]|nr:hypothetical protein [Prevotellaceae bacterium]